MILGWERRDDYWTNITSPDFDRDLKYRGYLAGVADLVAAIEEYLVAWNTNPKPFIWTATVESIMEKLSHCKQTLERIQPGCTLPRSRKTKRNNSTCL